MFLRPYLQILFLKTRFL